MGQALYRKYRSKSLDEIVGQEHVTTTLANAIKAGRISHAYLLCGPRGVGKTSIARILAHQINNLPYEDEAHLDIIEIDAASNRRIDEIRELRERVHTAPAKARYKVYIIDEVHMLTKEAFNALLKTLEEPPEHAVFILATTEAHKLPETIVSRTQRYSLRPVPEDQVVGHLREIAKGEKIQIDDDALALIAKHGEGSFRDSISLLDQTRSTAEHVTLADVERILGLAPDVYITQLVTALDNRSADSIVQTLASLYAAGHEPATVARQVSARLREDVLQGTCAAPHATLTVLQKLLDVPAARSPKHLLELVLLQAIFDAAADKPSSVEAAPVESVATPAPVQHAAAPKPSVPKPAAAAPKPQAVPIPASEKPAISVPAPKPAPEPAAKQETPAKEIAVPTPTPTIDPGALQDVTELWQQTLQEIKKQYNTLYGIARMAKPDFDGQHLVLGFRFAFHQKRINEAKNRKIFADVMERLYGQPVEISCVIIEPAPAKPEDVSAISNIFGGAELLS